MRDIANTENRNVYVIGLYDSCRTNMPEILIGHKGTELTSRVFFTFGCPINEVVSSEGTILEEYYDYVTEIAEYNNGEFRYPIDMCMF